MPRVICGLPNASDEISGVKFHLLEDGRRISDELSEEQASDFTNIEGYELDDDEVDRKTEPVAPEAPKLTRAQQKAAEKAAAAAAAEQAAADQKAADDKAAADQAAADEAAANLKAEQDAAAEAAAEAAAAAAAGDETKTDEVF